jgi:hypothetical protein
MRKDLILTPEEKLAKQQRLDANRRIRSIQTKSETNDIKIECTEESSSVYANYPPVREKSFDEIIKNNIVFSL